MRQVNVNHHRATSGSGCFFLIAGYFLTGLLLGRLYRPFGFLSFYGLVLNIPVFLLLRYLLIPLLFKLIFSKQKREDIGRKLNGLLPEKFRRTGGAAKNTSVFSINGATTIENPFAGIFVSGGAGSGKSKSLIEPMIKEAGKKGYTGVIYDFKFPELAKYVETAYAESPVKRYYVNFDDISRSNRINPISAEIMSRESIAREFAFSILANLNPSMISQPDFWSDNSTSLLAATFWYLREKWPGYCTLPHAISMILQPNFEALIMELSTVPKCADMIAPILTAYEQGADNQLAGVLSSLQVSLTKLNFNEIYYLLTESDFSLELNSPDSPGILVVGNNPQYSSTYAPVIGLILTAVSKQLNRPDKEKSIFMMDEFPTVFVPQVEQLPATARSNKVATILVCQDISQVNDRYGKEKGETILANLGNQFYGRTPNPATAKRVSEIFGREEKIVISNNRDRNIFSGRAGTVTESTRESDRVRVQDVANLDTGNFFTILSEGRNRQGLTSVPMDNNFKKSDILPFSSADERSARQAYDRVGLDVREVILRDAIERTKK